MSDLISRSKVISVLEQSEEHSLSGKMYISNAIYLLEKQPTAYDIDKVVEELEERTDFLKECTKYGNKNAEQQDKSYSTMMMYEVADLVEDLIEIVKQGGVYDNVCEYKIKDKVIYASCNNKQIASAFCWFNECGDYKYCPYCGKKIKVVE